MEKLSILFHEWSTTKPGGSGLGLLIVQTIVEQGHGGRIPHTPNHPSDARFRSDLPNGPCPSTPAVSERNVPTAGVRTC